MGSQEQQGLFWAALEWWVRFWVALQVGLLVQSGSEVSVFDPSLWTGPELSRQARTGSGKLSQFLPDVGFEGAQFVVLQAQAFDAQHTAVLNAVHSLIEAHNRTVVWGFVQEQHPFFIFFE